MSKYRLKSIRQRNEQDYGNTIEVIFSFDRKNNLDWHRVIIFKKDDTIEIIAQRLAKLSLDLLQDSKQLGKS